MTVLPYVVISIIASLGSLSASEARRLGVRAGLVLVGLWTLALLFAMLLPLAFPALRQGSFFSTSLLQRPAGFDFVDLYIPSNPFHSLANNVVPAVVLFSMVLGVALIGAPRKQVLLDVLAVASDMVGRATKLVVRLTPYGMFAVAAVAAGTLQIEQVARIQVYLVAYVSVALLLSLWVLPGLVAALTPVTYRELLGSTRDALLTAFVAGDLFIVLPALTDACKTLLERHVPAHDGEHAVEPARCDRAGLVQLPAHRQAAVAQFRPVRGLVRRRHDPVHVLSDAGLHGAAHLLRQPERRGAVPARPLPHPGRYVPAVPGHGRDQPALRVAARGRPHRGRRCAGQRRHRRCRALRCTADHPLCRDHAVPGSGPARRPARPLRDRPAAVLRRPGRRHGAEARSSTGPRWSRETRIRHGHRAARCSSMSRRQASSASATCPIARPTSSRTGTASSPDSTSRWPTSSRSIWRCACSCDRCRAPPSPRCSRAGSATS